MKVLDKGSEVMHRRAILLTLLGVAVALAPVAVALAVFSTRELQRFERAQVRRGVVVETAGQRLAPGLHVGRADLAGTLVRLGYVEGPGPLAPGHFRRSATAWEIALRSAPGARVALDLRGPRIARVRLNGGEVAEARLEGEVLAGAGAEAGERSRPVTLAEVPPVLVQAILAAEDRRFYEHGGVDARGVVRAAWRNLRARRVTEGGSTLTQQLVKTRLLDPERTLGRKLREAWLAVLVEWRYSKDEILDAYLNEVYLGQRGPVAIRGVGAAAHAYLGKEVHQLTAAEAALLAAMVRAPNVLSPERGLERARARRDAVLARMRQLGMLDARAYEAALREPVRRPARPRPGSLAPYFVDRVRDEIEQRLGDGIWRGGRGGRIVTTLDVSLQRFAETAVSRGLDRLETRYPRLRRAEPRERLQAALVALEPVTGHVLALVGGRDYTLSQYDRASVARRQPGSAFKPFVYLTALRRRGPAPAFTAASLIEDTPLTLRTGAGDWSPRNYEDRYEGLVTLRRAIEQSLNSATVRLGQAVGPAAVVETARLLGLQAPLAAVPAVSLGAFEVTPLDLARAYVPLANGGVRPGSVSTLREVVAADGARVALPAEPPAPVITPAEAYLMTSLLQGVMRSGTGAARAREVPADVAGKTGTSNDARDAWLVGYTSQVLAVVWVGFDDDRPHGLSAAEAALPIWTDFMRQAIEAMPPPGFAVPPGIVVAVVDAGNGRLAGDACPLVVREVFLEGTLPPRCEEHRTLPDRLGDWWERLRGWWGR